jgi:hypothetical protein
VLHLFQQFTAFTDLYPRGYTVALLIFSFVWFYVPTKMLYPHLGAMWETFVVTPVMAAFIVGMSRCVFMGDPWMLLAAVVYVVLMMSGRRTRFYGLRSGKY